MTSRINIKVVSTFRLLKTSFFACIIISITACGTTPMPSLLSQMKADQVKYSQFYQKMFQDLKQRAIQIKGKGGIAPSDSTMIQALAKFDANLNTYEERTNKSAEGFGLMNHKFFNGLGHI